MLGCFLRGSWYRCRCCQGSWRRFGSLDAVRLHTRNKMPHQHASYTPKSGLLGFAWVTSVNELCIWIKYKERERYKERTFYRVCDGLCRMGIRKSRWTRSSVDRGVSVRGVHKRLICYTLHIDSILNIAGGGRTIYSREIHTIVSVLERDGGRGTVEGGGGVEDGIGCLENDQVSVRSHLIFIYIYIYIW